MYTSYYFLFCMKLYLHIYAEYLLIIEFHNSIVFPLLQSLQLLILPSCVKRRMAYFIFRLLVDNAAAGKKMLIFT
jgi:hypothetical protein